ncbi:hypothetical protein [Geodermatophilus maliterrae]|uniref:Uncharacterized protein n=1 Tax=Geodermatophilus maliterrae TaxID=3162531 RepID=A0ABV3XFV5_9ACTN
MSHALSTRPTTCLRHPRHVWIASCADCTAWYLAGLKAGRGEQAPVSGPRPGGEPAGQTASVA